MGTAGSRSMMVAERGRLLAGGKMRLKGEGIEETFYDSGK